jgi:hypothetical protein
MKIGTKSLLFGVHQFLWHPVTVALAWRKLYGKWPTWEQAVCIFFHDWGYWGKPNMDGPEGKAHPEAGARIAAKIIFKIARFRGARLGDAALLYADVYLFTLCHSTAAAEARGLKPSQLYYADKACVLHEPRWLYLLRAKASGEVWEYIDVALKSKVWSNEWNLFFIYQPRATKARLWHNWYQNKTRLRMQRIKI